MRSFPQKWMSESSPNVSISKKHSKSQIAPLMCDLSMHCSLKA